MRAKPRNLATPAALLAASVRLTSVSSWQSEEEEERGINTARSGEGLTVMVPSYSCA